MKGTRHRKRRVRVSERYRHLSIGRVQVSIRIRPTWQAGASTAKAFAKNLNDAREEGERIRTGAYHDREWLPLASWYSAWRAASAILLPSLREGRLARSPWFLSPETGRRFQRFSAIHPVRFTTTDRGVPIVAGDDARADVVHLLFDLVMSPARDRLKRCGACGRWFADETKNRAQRWCSEPCHRQGWNRAARRTAGHAQYKKKGARR